MRNLVKRAIGNPLFSGSAIMIIGSNAASVLNYFYHFIIGRLLGPSLYGELASLISVIGLLGIIPGAVSLVIVKQISSAKSDGEVMHLIRWFKSKIFIFSLIFSIIILIFSPIISSFLHIQKLSYLFAIAAFFLFSLQGAFNRSILQGVLKFREMVNTILIENGAKLLLSILFVLAGFAVGGAMVAFVLASFFGYYLTNYYLKEKSKEQPKDLKIDFRPMLLLTIPVLIQSVSITSIYSSDVILVKHFFSSYDAGIYASLSTLGKIIFFGAGPISGVMFPLVSKRSSRGESYEKVFLYSFIATALFSASVCAFYWLMPDLAISMLFGKAYLGSSNLLIWFGTFMSFFTLSALLVSFGISLGKNKIVIFPLFFAVLQILLIYIYHESLFLVVVISNIVTALLLTTLLIYLKFENAISYGRQSSKRDKINFDNSSGI